MSRRASQWMLAYSNFVAEPLSGVAAGARVARLIPFQSPDLLSSQNRTGIQTSVVVH